MDQKGQVQWLKVDGIILTDEKWSPLESEGHIFTNQRSANLQLLKGCDMAQNGRHTFEFSAVGVGVRAVA